MTPTSRLIEFCGIPASGKSTLLKALLGTGDCNGWTFTKDIPARADAAHMPRYVVRQPDRRLLFQAERFRAAYRDFFREADRICGDVALDGFFFSLTAQCYQDWRDADPPGRVLLFDEGFIGRSAALAATRGSDVRSLVKVAPLPDILVMADAPPGVAFDRATRRHGDPGKMRDAVVSLHGDEAMFKCRSEALAAACETAKARGARTLRIDTELPPDAALAELRTQLSECLPDGAGRQS